MFSLLLSSHNFLRYDIIYFLKHARSTFKRTIHIVTVRDVIHKCKYFKNNLYLKGRKVEISMYRFHHDTKQKKGTFLINLKRQKYTSTTDIFYSIAGVKGLLLYSRQHGEVSLNTNLYQMTYLRVRNMVTKYMTSEQYLLQNCEGHNIRSAAILL